MQVTNCRRVGRAFIKGGQSSVRDQRLRHCPDGGRAAADASSGYDGPLVLALAEVMIPMSREEHPRSWTCFAIVRRLTDFVVYMARLVRRSAGSRCLESSIFSRSTSGNLLYGAACVLIRSMSRFEAAATFWGRAAVR